MLPNQAGAGVGVLPRFGPLGSRESSISAGGLRPLAHGDDRAYKAICSGWVQSARGEVLRQWVRGWGAQGSKPTPRLPSLRKEGREKQVFGVPAAQPPPLGPHPGSSSGAQEAGTSDHAHAGHCCGPGTAGEGSKGGGSVPGGAKIALRQWEPWGGGV